jgi:hypothetical protein
MRKQGGTTGRTSSLTSVWLFVFNRKVLERVVDQQPTPEA